MQNKIIDKIQPIIKTATGMLICLMVLPAYGQHRGDRLGFQGLNSIENQGVKALAMGGAYTSIYGELEALYWNPAGLVGLSGLQVAVNAGSYKQSWNERQDYRPNRQLVTLSFILDGLYSPDPAYNGWWDNEAFLADSNYVVNEPVLGKDPYSEEAADWKKEMDGFGLHDLTFALPLTIMQKSVVVSGGYSQQLLALDYDRNDTYLIPHPSSDVYNPISERVTSQQDSVHVEWYEFSRSRSGPLKAINAALAVGVTDYLKVGIGFKHLSGETDDTQSFNKVANIEIKGGYNLFQFQYDTLNVITSGTSTFSGNTIEIGAILNLKSLSIGASVTPGYTIKREWDYTVQTTDANETISKTLSGTDEIKTPLSYSVGISLRPKETITLSMDLERRPYEKAEWEISPAAIGGDTIHTDWKNQTLFRVGAEYKPVSWLSILGGYQMIPAEYVPDGAAIKDKGPVTDLFSLGLSVGLMMGRLDITYQFGDLKYYDQYFSNTNYVLKRFNNLMFGYTIML